MTELLERQVLRLLFVGICLKMPQSILNHRLSLVGDAREI